MRVKLIDIDNKYRESKRRGKRFPNLALMKVSAYYKSLHADVGFSVEDPDITYISCVFPRNYDHALHEASLVKNGLIYGGSGIPLDKQYGGLPPSMECLKPDYDLYPFQEYSLGFTTRGCPNNCGWCIVPKKEGKFRRAQHMKEFHDFRFKSCKLLDNNILFDKDWFFENTNWAIKNKVGIDITQGMDIRLLTDEIAEQLAHIRFVDGRIHFAWDRIGLEDRVKAGIEMLRDHGINVRRNLAFYVLVGYHEPGQSPDPFCKDLYRCNNLREWGVRAFAMPYNEEKTFLISSLVRWAGRPGAYWKVPFWQYDRLGKWRGKI